MNLRANAFIVTVIVEGTIGELASGLEQLMFNRQAIMKYLLVLKNSV
jgi:hypothetical protein